MREEKLNLMGLVVVVGAVVVEAGLARPKEMVSPGEVGGAGAGTGAGTGTEAEADVVESVAGGCLEGLEEEDGWG